MSLNQRNCKRKKRLKALSLFANIGVAEAYLKDIGVDVAVANEFVEKRAGLYQAIYPDCDMICGDITDPKILNKIVKRAKEECPIFPVCRADLVFKKNFFLRYTLFYRRCFLWQLKSDYVV